MAFSSHQAWRVLQTPNYTKLSKILFRKVMITALSQSSNIIQPALGNFTHWQLQIVQTKKQKQQKKKDLIYVTMFAILGFLPKQCSLTAVN